ncbi:MAG: NDP-hexose 2,3-dehydratase family protein, partial [Aeriscardovia sp.]|nr:NDP-hexose 2,3-dehydratase family protein [Aeriscardovia sp.]
MIIKSLLNGKNDIHSTQEIKEWIERRNFEVKVSVEQIPFSKLQKWYVDKEGAVRHESGKFFSIEGIHVETDYGILNSWEQPIINQPEVGYLGILTKEFDGVLYFLMQAKIEPGNVNCVQI